VQSVPDAPQYARKRTRQQFGGVEEAAAGRRDIERQRETQRDTERETERERHRERHTERHRGTQRDTGRHRET